MTDKEKSWLIRHYWLAKPLKQTAAASHLTELEQSLVRRAFAIVKKEQWFTLTPSYISTSALGRQYVEEHHLMELLLWGMELHNYGRVEDVLHELPMERLPELLVCCDEDLRARVSKRLARYGTTR